MAKKRKTRQEKVILQLKRKVAQGTSFKPSQEAKISEPAIEVKTKPDPKKTDAAILSYDLSLVKKDLLKTLVLSAIILSLEVVLYLKLG